MRFITWQGLKRLRSLWETPPPEPAMQAARILHMKRNVVLPVKAVIIILILYYIFYSPWMTEVATTRGVVLETLQDFTIFYVLFNLAIATMVLVIRRFPLRLVQWLVFTVGLLDGLFAAALVVVTGGFGSVLYWVFPGLIVVNALSIPLAAPQIVLNLLLSGFFMCAGILAADITENENVGPYIVPRPLHPAHTGVSYTNTAGVVTRRNVGPAFAPPGETAGAETATEPFLLRVMVLWLLTACCYGVQVLGARQKQAEEEAKEFAARRGQLHAEGRLAAEIAHQIKNPLAIINNAVFTLQRTLATGRNDVSQQIQIIREEVERSARFLTQLMGYAQLSEGRVEKLSVTEELERAIIEVFPPAAAYEVQIHRDYAPELPPLLMLRAHLS